jgi:predicted permease
MLWYHKLRYGFKALGMRIRFLLRKDAVEEELDEELRFHLEMETKKNLREGMSPGSARRKAHLTFGGLEQTKERVRDRRGVRSLESILEDTRFALRQLKNAPVFTLVAILTLAIGIGANTSIFSLVNGALIRPRPFSHIHSLVNVYTAIEHETPYATSSSEDLEDLRTLDDVFAAVGAFRGAASRIQGDGEAQMVLMEAVTSNLLPMVGLEMALGRSFLPEEGLSEGGSRVTILGHGFWAERFGSDPAALGQTISLSGLPFTIVGVASEEFESFTAQGFRASLFVPMAAAEAVLPAGDMEVATERGVPGYKIIARLGEGVELHQAQARVNGLSLALQERLPHSYAGRSFNLYPTASVALQPDVDAFFMKAALLILFAVGVVLLLAATNLAGSLLARGLDRREEIALRMALGAGRGRLVRQFLTETLILGVLGGLAGLFLGRWCLDLLATLAPPTSLPLVLDTGMDSRVLLFTMAVTGGAVLAAGLAPALQSTRSELASVLKSSGGRQSRSQATLQKALVGAQVALSMVLLVTGALFVRSLREAEGMDPGFGARDAAMVWLDLSVGGVPKEEWEGVAQELVERAQALPGMMEVGASNGVPLSEALYQGEYLIPGAVPPLGEESHWAHFLTVNEGFLEVMGMGLLAGRSILETDGPGAEGVVLVSEAAARRYWPGGEVLGRTIEPVGSNQTFKVVGVVRDTKVANFREGPTPLLYFPRRQYSRRNEQLWLVGRGIMSPGEAAGALRRLVGETDPDLVVVQTGTLSEHLAASLSLPRMAAIFMGFFGLMALALASLGLYGLVSYRASRRTREVGIRVSLGAGKGSVVRMVVMEGLTPVWTGVLLGWVGAMGLAHLAGGYLIGVGPFDPTTLLGVPTLLVLVSAVAAWVPARRASAINPTQALRTE